MNIKNRSFLFKIGFTVLAVSGSIVLTIIQTVAQISREQARAVTVMITWPGSVEGDKGDGGSGVLVQRQGNRYRVLTNCHVLFVQGEYTLTIAGRDKVKVNIPNPQRSCHPSGIDLAIVEFESTQTYTVVTEFNTATDPEQILNDSTIVVAGFNKIYREPNSVIVQPRALQFIPGSWRSPRQGASDGYDLLHTAAAVDGMSGGPIFDSAGRLVAIHGETVPLSERVTAFAAIPVHYYTSWQQQSEIADAGSLRFFCGYDSDGIRTTFVEHIQHGQVPIIRYVSDEHQDRCDQISRAFENNNKRGTLAYIGPGIFNGSAVVCASPTIPTTSVMNCPEENVLIFTPSLEESNRFIKSMNELRGPVNW